jgi:acyl transferase domain-containing protein
VGAAAGLPLTLTASKSWLGHAEPAAGVVGLLHAAQAAASCQALPIAHLRALNPYASHSIEEHQRFAAAWSLPRQAGGMPLLGASSQGHLVGTSAFAFQGTNAHVLLEGPGGLQAQQQQQQGLALRPAAPGASNSRCSRPPRTQVLYVHARAPRRQRLCHRPQRHRPPPPTFTPQPRAN